jgi:hypothetical protein
MTSTPNIEQSEALLVHADLQVQVKEMEGKKPLTLPYFHPRR